MLFNSSFIKFMIGFTFLIAISFGIIVIVGNLDDNNKVIVEKDMVIEK